MNNCPQVLYIYFYTYDWLRNLCLLCGEWIFVINMTNTDECNLYNQLSCDFSETTCAQFNVFWPWEPFRSCNAKNVQPCIITNASAERSLAPRLVTIFAKYVPLKCDWLENRRRNTWILIRCIDSFFPQNLQNCQEQDALTNQASQSQTPKSSSAKTVKDKHIAVPSTSAPKAHRNTHDTSRSKSHTTSSSSKTAGSTNSSRKDGSAGVSLISPSVKSNINNSSKNSPQSVAIVAGRTYIMVPKKSMDPLPSNITDGLPNGIVHSTKT